MTTLRLVFITEEISLPYLQLLVTYYSLPNIRIRIEFQRIFFNVRHFFSKWIILKLNLRSHVLGQR